MDTRDCSNGRLGQWPHQQEQRGDGRQVAPCRVTSESPRERSVYNTQIDTRTARPTPQPNGFRPANERRDEQTAPRLPFATISFFSLLHAVMDVQSRQLRIGHIPDPRRREFHGWSGFRRYTPISPFVVRLHPFSPSSASAMREFRAAQRGPEKRVVVGGWWCRKSAVAHQ